MRSQPCLGLLLLPFLMAALAAQEPRGSVRGVVLDGEFGVPVAGVEVVVVESGRKTLSTDLGTFLLAEVPVGRHTLRFAKDGYVTVVKPDVVVTAGTLTELDVSLTGDFTEMEEFVVQDALGLGRGSEAGLLALRLDSPSLMDSISADLLVQSGASDAAGALRLVTGASLQDGKTAVIRGLPDRYVSSQMNRVRLPSADEDKRAVELDQFPATVIESIQVSKTFTPDQQGDASGGAVDVRLKGVPSDPLFLSVRGQATHNSQVSGRSNFLSYDGGGVHYQGEDGGGRDIQYQNLGRNWTGAVGVCEREGPAVYLWSLAGGGMHEFGNGVKIGGIASVFHEHDSSSYDDGHNDSYWVEDLGQGITPRRFQEQGETDFKTGLFDVAQSSQSVQWGALGAFGIESANHGLDFVYLRTRTAEDTATLAEDTRGKAYFYPDYEPDDPTTPGHEELLAAPYLRLETLDYTERTAETLQLSGRHRVPLPRATFLRGPELDWTISRSSADLNQPDKRQFGSLWYPGQPGDPPIPPTYAPYKPAANFTQGNLQRIWKVIEEESEQYSADLKLPFAQWGGHEGYLKLGLFEDKVDRRFDQETFSNFGDNSDFQGAPFRQRWSASFPFQNHPITELQVDVDYTGTQKISAWYGMLDLPLTSFLNVIGGARFEDTAITVVNDPEENAKWFPKGASGPEDLLRGQSDVSIQDDDVLPSVGLVFRPWDSVTVRANYAETIARQTFKELTPILQQEFLGGPVFIGNPDLKMSSLENYDLRLDWAPYEGGLLSASWFKKDIDGAIEYVQRVVGFDFTTAENYPKGRLDGYELELKQKLGQFWEPLDGVSLGANATFIGSDVQLTDEEIEDFQALGVNLRSRDMTNAPEHLFNFYATYDLPATGTKLGAFYTVQGDTLVAGAGATTGRFVPSLYARQFDTLNLSLAQRLGQYMELQIQVKNLTDPEIQEVYRSGHIGGDVARTSYTRGVEYAVGIGGRIVF